MSCNNATVGDNTAQWYHALECYWASFQRLLGYGPCPVRGVGQRLVILYFALFLLVPVIITPAALTRWYPLFSQPLGIPRVCPLQGMFLCILLKSHSSFRFSSNSTIPKAPSLFLMVRENYPGHFRIKSDFKGHIFHCAMLRSHLYNILEGCCAVSVWTSAAKLTIYWGSTVCL